MGKWAFSALLMMYVFPVSAQLDHEYYNQEERRTQDYNMCVQLFNNAQYTARGAYSANIAIDNSNHAWRVSASSGSCSYTYVGTLGKTVRRKGHCDTLLRAEGSTLAEYTKCSLSAAVDKELIADTKEALERARLASLPNSCPDGFAYEGNGTCRQVVCRDDRFSGNHSDLAGKQWGCKSDIFGFRPSLDWGSETSGLRHDPNCPSRTPSIGWQRSCNDQ